MICSPDLTDQDMDAIRKGEDTTRVIDNKLISELRHIAQHPDNEIGLQFLSTLLSIGALQIKIAYRPESPGIFHDKIGVFRSHDSSAVAFMGSSNESQAAILSEWNHESFAVFSSWEGPADAERVAQMAEYFTELWNDGEAGLTVAPLGDIPREEFEKHRHPEGIQAAGRALRSKLSESNRASPNSAWEPRTLLNHQSSVVRDWEEHGFCGIVKHATGAGKTLTGLEIIRRWASAGRPALVLVPSDLLLSQWAGEIKRELTDPQPNVLYVGGSKGSRNWSYALPDFTREASFLGPRIVLATMQTASTERFLHNVLPGNHLLLVADEVHRIGSHGHRSILDIQAGGRLGLSATPERFGDVDGTRAIFNYFGAVLLPEFGIPDAIKCGRLVPYDYHVHQVALNRDEQRHWLEFTDRIKASYARLPDDGTGGKRQTEEYRMLLIRRASILKRAEGKVPLAVETIREEYDNGDRWLVYCDNSDQLRLVLEGIRNIGVDAYEYWSGMSGSRPETLDFFERIGGVLVAIRCLDEGVDPPRYQSSFDTCFIV